MTFELLTDLSRVFLIIGFVLLIITIRLYFKLEIYKSFHIITGRKLKTHSKPDDSKSRYTSAELTKEKVVEEVQDKTVVLQMPTEVLEDADKTIVLGTFQVKYDVIYIHTSERI